MKKEIEKKISELKKEIERRKEDPKRDFNLARQRVKDIMGYAGLLELDIMVLEAKLSAWEEAQKIFKEKEKRILQEIEKQGSLWSLNVSELEDIKEIIKKEFER